MTAPSPIADIDPARDEILESSRPGTRVGVTLHSFTRGLARELGSRDITVNLVQPGSTNTDMNPADGESAEFQRALMPLGRFGEPQDAAATVAFLASPAARHITGVVLNVDGGLNT